MQVENILQSKGMTVHTVLAHAPISDAIRMLNEHRIGAVVVVADNGSVAGILSERDIVRNLAGDPAGLLKRAVREVMTTTVISCGRRTDLSELMERMTTTVITCDRRTDISQLMERMTTHRIRHIPIVEDGQLVGIVSIGDVVKRKIEEAEQEALALREYIAS